MSNYERLVSDNTFKIKFSSAIVCFGGNSKDFLYINFKKDTGIFPPRPKCALNLRNVNSTFWNHQKITT